MTCVIIDDEAKSRETIVNILTKYCPDVDIIGQAQNVEEGYTAITTLRPEFIFLDIQMPGGSGLNLLSFFKDADFKVIFTTAYKDYAIDAIKMNAVDYLLKPIAINEVIDAVDKIKRLLAKKSLSTGPVSRFLHLNSKTTIDLIPVEAIVYCEAESTYTNIYLNDGSKKVMTKTIKDVEEQLPVNDFFRVHNSYIVQKRYIKQYIKGDGGSIITSFNHHIDVSRRNKNEFIEWLSS
ncbi:MAG: response regulator transcription factor [Saprospiraceae bacterium]|nr:response regulator transcription factor [Saprospiraceae bacterium]MBK7222188.1 response regulator transcription factor [Saprospiraceae bacterium]MBK7788863.1 response regulator transcription factor [Saprospiraceae bacterium]MBK8109289.1 response regulator transcription factor [Saprospiraceae bacterium]MBK8850176.1 response regulator transcription factor [Saprospiraceae bacterium]